ncbi:UvrD-helicase domain-containing protein [Labilibaculum antarcticum]|uniref:DNA 3'-5' helicase n=1 Tax=Labilibaculum antarcticum TaxID=1717717 RepID=A0A1Y1CQT8_9BACT|nr:UvrD-helicase domain-containing protein [Labilibaculum antarcticum]BAX82353.1 UvrD/REP helicase [Labilibaculum antarcticum]
MSNSINLILHDSFLDSFSRVPKNIQKKTRELIKKFKLNPTSSAINYEKISSFSDKSLRTVRVDLKYRAIIQAPEEGSNYHLLWVDNHDEAMSWAMNKVFEWNKNTQSFQMYDLPETKIQTKIIENETLYNKYSVAHLKAIGTPDQMIETIRNLCAIDDLTKIKNNLPADNFEYLYFLAEGIAYEEILEEIEAGKNNLEAESSDNARKHIYMLTDDEDIDKILSGDFDKWKVFLHPSQRKLAFSDYKGPVKVTGGAGTGKTVCAMHRAKYLAQKIEIFAKPILFTTYTKSLTSYLQNTISDLGIAADSIQIINFDKLIFEIARDKKYQVIPSNSGFLTEKQELEIWKEVLEYNPSSMSEDFLMSEYHDVLLRKNVKSLEQYLKTSRTGRTVRIGRKEKIEIWNLIQDFAKRKDENYSKLELCNLLSEFFSNRDDKPYSHIICDEIQDFTNNELTLMRSLVSEHENDMFLVGDPFQNIYQRKINFSQSGISVRGQRSKKLKINYRTTEQIKLMALKTVSKESYDNFDGEEENSKGYVSLMYGDEPQYQIFNTPEEQDEYILSNIKGLLDNEQAEASDICVCARTNYAVDDIKKTLNKNDIKYNDISSSKALSNAIKVSSFHNMKGHEFKFVFVLGASKANVPLKHSGYQDYSFKEKAEYEKQERSLYYVVFSRAIQGLFISGIGEKSEWF